MRKALNILVILSLMFVIFGSGMTLAGESNSKEGAQVKVTAFVDGELEELIGLWVTVWYADSGGMGDFLYCKGKVLGRKGSNWLIMQDAKGIFTWCYIPTIRKIQIKSTNYVPKFD